MPYPRITPCRILGFLLVMFLSPVVGHGQQADTTIFGWSSRKLTGVALSTIIPGAGQSYLGHSTKGAILTVGFFGSGLMTVLSENNVIGRNERIDELKALYSTSTTWVYSEELWQQMRETKSILDSDISRRDIFLKVAIVFWLASVTDAIFFSEDRGTSSFGSRLTPVVSVAEVPGTGIPAVKAQLSFRF